MLNIRIMVTTIILVMLWLTPFLSFFEVVALFKGTLQNQTTALTPIYIKVVKDVGIFLLLVITTVAMLGRYRIYKNQVLILLVIVFVLSVLISVVVTPFNIVVMGIRWFMPVLLIIVGRYYLNDASQVAIARCLKYLFFIAFVLQIFEAFFASRWYGVSALGLNLRNPGFFLIPSTHAAFTLMVLYYLHKYDENSKFVRYVLIPISMYLTASGTGYIGYFSYIVFQLLDKVRPRFMLIAFIAIPTLLIATNLDVILGRDIYRSGNERVDIVNETVESLELVSSTLGLKTNAGVLLSGTAEADIADSTIVSYLGNLGLVGFTLFLILLIAVWMNNRNVMLLYVCTYPIFFSTILNELYPVNILFYMNIGFFLKRNSTGNLVSNRLCFEN